MDDGFDGIEAVDDFLGFVESVACAFEVLGFGAELDSRDFDGGVDVAFAFVELLAEGFEECKGLLVVDIARSICASLSVKMVL